jgi:hypothetical protein
MNCSLRVPMTRSMEVEPLVATVPLSEEEDCWEDCWEEDVPPPAPQPVRIAAVRVMAIKAGIPFFMVQISFSNCIFGFSIRYSFSIESGA